jgi:hypothetical protein
MEKDMNGMRAQRILLDFMEREDKSNVSFTISQTSFGVAPIHYIAKMGHTKCCKVALQFPNVDPKICDSIGRSSLYMAGQI